MKNTKKTYAINGWFLTQRITGIQRYAYEITKELDKLINKGDVEIVVPFGTKVPRYENLEVIETGKARSILWEQHDYEKYLRKNNRLSLCFCNVIPIRYPYGIATIHDISCKVNPQFFKNTRAKVSSTWYKKIYSVIARSNMRIITVSEFSKNEISDVYKVDKSRITVAYSAWQHMNKIRTNENALNKYGLKERQYFFAMATMMPNKNFKWICEAAKANPNNKFAVAGLNKEKVESSLDNLYLLGYVTDEEAKELMAKCEAFIMPTFYEGFGLPPLEAIASGADKIVISDLPVLHEVYGDEANYVNPCEYDGNLSSNIVADKDRLLDRYSWSKSAEVIKELIDK